MRRAILVAVALFCFVAAQSASLVLCHAGEAEDNARIMEDAARSLKFSLPENRAYMLEKQSGLLGGSEWSQVAVIFGYVDNRAACRDIADALTEKSALLRQVYGIVDKFECNPID